VRAAQLLAEVEQEIFLTRDYTGCSELSPAVREALRTVPRHVFVDEAQHFMAYINAPLPIGHGQTISQPYIVALMTQLLDVDANSTVLEVGSGSGYQAAVLSRVVREVYSVEVIAELAAGAARHWQALGYTNIHGRLGNGAQGWPEHAPYDGIIVTAAAPGVPGALIEQLKPHGRLVIPVGIPFSGQDLQLITKDATGKVDIRSVLPVAFVPLVGNPA
jgi:protein-L-isoaspartate(D-aspartate) O-methyltransferase